MGSTGYQQGVTFTEAIREELGIGTYVKVLAKAAGEPEFDGRQVTWFALERIADGERFIVQALWYRANDSYGVTIKLVDESMGPSDLNVPDRVWNAVPTASLSLADDSYAAEWRKRVAEYKAEFPLSIAKDLDVGGWYVLAGGGNDDDYAVQYDGEQRSGRRSTVKVFMFPPEDGWESAKFGYGSGRKFRLRRGEEKYGRARIAKRPSWA